jgi:hypothetical protein
MAKMNWVANKKRQLIDHRLDYGQEDAPWREMLLECALRVWQLKAHDEEFLFSIADWRGALTPRQMNRLRDIRARLLKPAAPPRPTPRLNHQFHRHDSFDQLNTRDPYDQPGGVDFDDPPWN